MAVNSGQDVDRQFKRILSTLIWVSWAGSLFGILLGLYYRDWKLFAVTFTGFSLIGVPFVLLKRRQLHASGLFLMLLVIATTTFIATVGQGIRDLAVFGYMIVIIFAGLALSRPYFLLCVGLSLVAVCWLVFGESFGLFVTFPFIGGVTNWFYLAGMTIIILIAALAVDLLSSNLRTSLQREQAEVARRERVEEEIRQLNAVLEQRVEERTYELFEAQEALLRQEKLAVMGQLAGGVGHELRNPLSVINSSIYYLKLTQPQADSKVQEHHAMIEQEVRNADKIITDLLDFARGIASTPQPTSVPELVQRSLERFPAPPTVKVSLKIPAGLPLVFADPHQVEQILGNLVQNACQAMGESGRLTISAKLQKEMLALAVTDTGSGITPENMKKLFEPLFTTKVKGIGLGLAVSRKLAEANRGHLEVESQPGKGSTFTLLLPLEPSKAP